MSMLLVLYALGFTNLFLRSSLGIMAPTLSRDMQLSPEALSLVASSFFFAYALMQIPSGMLIDRIGPRRTLSVLLLFTAVGAGMFAMADNASELVFARIMMGIGCAGIFSGAFVVIGQWVAADKLVTQTGILNSFAALGGLCATAPLAILLTYYDWHECFWVFSAGVAVLLIAVIALIREPPEARAARSESLLDVFSGVARAIRQPGMKRLLVVGIPISTQTAIMGAWGTPYLRDVHGLDEIARGNIMLVMAVCSVFGHTFFGWLARWLNSVKRVIIGCSITILLLTLVLVLVARPPVWLVAATFAAIGFVAMYPMVAFSHTRGLVAPDLVGRGIAITNMGLMSAIAFSQLIFGWIVGLFPIANGVAPEIAYRAAFAVLAALTLFAIIVYAPVRDSKPSEA